MKTQTKCPGCQSTHVEPGSLHSTGRLLFRPEHAKFMKLKTANIDVNAALCLDCGLIWLAADVDRVKALTDQQ